MIFHNDIQLDRVGESSRNNLPRGISAIIVNDNVIFVRRMAGKFMPVSQEEQTRLTKKHIS